MFRSKRSGLLRRLWRSRLVTERDGGDGSKRSEGDLDDLCGGNPEKTPKTEHRQSVSHTDPSLETFSEACNRYPPDSAEQEGCSHHDQGAMCVPEHRGYAQGHESDSGTVTCCLFREWGLRRPRRPYSSLRKDGGASCQCSPGHTSLHGNCLPVVEQEVKSVVYVLLKRLKEKPLEALLKTVETKGGITSECIMMSQLDLRLDGQHISPHYLLCKLFRWKDLNHTAQLKALVHCQSFGTVDNAMACCNPYHYSRLCGPESPPPPYSLTNYENKPLDSSLSYTEAPAHSPNPSLPLLPPPDYTDTGTSVGSLTSGGQRSHWCSVAYWEQRTRVGRLYPAHEASLSIFYDLPQGTGLCLGQLHANAYQRHRDHPATSQRHGDSGGAASAVRQTRSKIGYGIVLSREPDGAWVYNRSMHPVFVHSPTLDLPSARGLCVKRVMPGYSLRMFDYERSSWIVESGVKPEFQEGPWDPHSVRISFAKGWGPCYSRQFITSCPCWLEVLLNNHR